MGAQHTPGPWVANVTFPIDNATVFAEAEFDDIHSAPIASCADHDEQRRSVAECQANARLIAAAPDLLAAARAMANKLVIEFGFLEHQHELSQLRAAVAKAEPRS